MVVLILILFCILIVFYISYFRGVITITEDGQRHVTLGRGFTRYEFPKSNPKVEEYIVNVFEKRHNVCYNDIQM